MLSVFFAFTTFLLAIFAGFSLYVDNKKQKALEKADREIREQLYELNLLRQINDKVGYSLSFAAIAEAIILNVQNLFDASTISYGIKNRNKTISVKTFIKEGVSPSFTQLVSKIILSGMSSIDPSVAGYRIIEQTPKYISQVDLYTHFDAVPESYFNIPLVFENELYGMINMSSTKHGIYQDADMSLLYKIVNAAQIAVGRLHEAIEIEKSKLDSLILSLPVGTIMFSVEKSSISEEGSLGFSLTVINRAAKKFLKIDGFSDSASVDGVDNIEEVDITRVLSSFGPNFQLSAKIKEVLDKKTNLTIPETEINSLPFAIFINPVFRHKSQDIIGVAVIMQDMIIEKKLEKLRENFTNMIVHELRAPASAIRGAAGLLISDKLTKDDEEKIVHVISDSTESMLSTIGELLDIGQMEEGKLKIHKEKNDLEKLILDHIEVFSYAAKEKNVSIFFSKTAALPPFAFDAVRIGQVINNLVSNSLKFSNSGGKINVEIRRDNANIEVIVSDNGIGIPADKKPILFTKFGQIDPDKIGIAGVKNVAATSTPAALPGGGSSGLGLYVSKQIIDAHGGKIWIESEEGKGTRAYFTLPLIIQPAQATVVN